MRELQQQIAAWRALWFGRIAVVKMKLLPKLVFFI